MGRIFPLFLSGFLIIGALASQAHQGQAHQGQAHQDHAHHDKAHHDKAHQGKAHQGKAHQVPKTATATVDESNILFEEMMKSVEHTTGDIFDSDVLKAAPALGAPSRARRQVDQGDIRDALCRDKNPGDFFRLVAGASACRDVVACAEQGLQAIRCPPGLAFSLKKQTCDWRKAVTDCDTKARPKLVLPLLNTKEPLCGRGELACGDGLCLAQRLFCDDKPDCIDGSDENLCGANDPNRAEKCDTSSCRLPECFCSEDGRTIPGGLAPQDTPQMIVLTFDDAVNVNNYDVIETVLNENLVNPNGCSAKATFFVSHRYTNYSMVQELHRQGHEVAVHSVTHDNTEKYWDEGTQETWEDEMSGGRAISSAWANIQPDEILGARAPLLRLGGNRQFAALVNTGFTYDSSMVAPLSNPPYWPYSLDYAAPHRCHGNFQVCPSRSHAGVMEMVMNEFDPREEPSRDQAEQVSGCVMLDSCSSISTPDGFYNVLTHNFIRHYEQNRAPMGLFLHAAWLKKSPEMMEALQFWLDEVLSTYTDVYLVTMQQVMAWMRDPVNSADARRRFPGWRGSCTPADRPADRCPVARNCPLPSPAHGGLKQRLQTCSSCPASYPWLRDVQGSGTPEDGTQGRISPRTSGGHPTDL